MAAEATTTLVEDFRPFVESKLWELQRQYFAARGQQAWSAGEVPHYITSNPVVAAGYAEVLVAFRRDRLRRDPGEEALWIVELGAGSGRFAHHLLQQLAALCEREGLDPAGFRYVLSDFCAANLEAWAQHPRFVPLFASGQLERGLVRLRQRQEGGGAPEAAALLQKLELDHRSEPLAAAPFAEPILDGLLANFDFLPGLKAGDSFYAAHEGA
jgi:hypothetical protein